MVVVSAVALVALRQRIPVREGARSTDLQSSAMPMKGNSSAHHAVAPQLDDDASTFEKVVIEIPMSELLEFAAVKEWLGSHMNARGPPHEAKLTDYLPARMVIEFDPTAMEGHVGHDASGGFVAFNLYNAELASWVIVMDMKGKIISIAPAASGRNRDTIGGMDHFDGLKCRDEEHLLLASNENMTGTGRGFVYDWSDHSYVELGHGGTAIQSHDIQWAHGRDAFWAPMSASCRSGANVTLWDATTGVVLLNMITPNQPCGADVNHAQLLEDDTVVFVSYRAMNAFAKYTLNASAHDNANLDYLIGGTKGTWPIVDLINSNGSIVYPPGTKVWDYRAWTPRATARRRGEGCTDVAPCRARPLTRCRLARLSPPHRAQRRVHGRGRGVDV